MNHDLILSVIDSIMDEAASSDHDLPQYTERDLTISSIWGIIAVVREYGDHDLIESILSEHPELVPSGS